MKTSATLSRGYKLSLDQLLIICFSLIAVIINLAPLNISDDFKGSWNDISWTLFPLATCLKALQTAKVCTDNRKGAWQFIALGCFIWFLGMLVWDFYRLVLHVYPPYPSFADLGYLLIAPLITLGIIHFREESITISFMFYQITRISVIFFTLLIIHYLIYGSLIENQKVTTLYIITSLSYPLLFFSSFIHVISDTWYRYDVKSQQTILLIIIGILIHALANAEYAYSLLALDYYSSAYVDIAWTVGFVPIYFAAILQQHNSDKNRQQQSYKIIIKLSEYINKSFLPLILLGLSATILFSRNTVSANLSDGFIILVSIFTILLVGYIWLSERKERGFETQLYAKDLVINSLVEAIPYGIQECDLQGNIIFSNEAMHDILSAPANSLIGRKVWHNGISSDQIEKRKNLFQRIIKTRPTPYSFIANCLRDDGSQIILKTDWNYRYNPNGDLNSIVSVVTDITLQRHNEEKLKQAATVFSSTTDAVLITDKNHIIIAANKAFMDISGYSEKEAIGKNIRFFQSERHPEEFYNDIWDTIEKDEVWNDEVWNSKKNGDIYPSWTRISTITDDMNNIINYVVVFSDITKIKQSEEHLKFLAHHDALTKLPNRTSLDIKLEQIIHRALRHNQKFAIFFIDLDQFKHINDSLGHAIGDRILVETSLRLQNIARNEDTISRLGGDEFVLIVDTSETIHDSAIVARRILEEFTNPFNIDDLQLHITPSIGIALYPENGNDPETLLKNADAAMYRAKLDGRNNFAYYSQELTQKASERIKYEGMLRKALENNELSLHYQPQIDIEHNKVHGIEALLRWDHPVEGMIPPSTFIPIAEDSGLICNIGQWVLQRSCQFMKQLLLEGIDLKHISVNVSGVQFLRSQFVDYVTQLLQETDLDGKFLELEITESIIMNDRIKSIDALHKLAELGISLSIDDFGTGYSSLSYLKKLPVNCIKIDKSFISDIPIDKDDEAIAKSIIALGHSLNLEIIAEGVEQQEQLAFLQREGCKLVQGYLFSKPVSVENIMALLKQNEKLFQNIN